VAAINPTGILYFIVRSSWQRLPQPMNPILPSAG
jgi:hypothetical protein